MPCRLATEALTRGSTDNITVVVAFLRPVDTLESVFKGGKQKHSATATFYSSRYLLAADHAKVALNVFIKLCLHCLTIYCKIQGFFPAKF